ncbi:hypothetical protein GALMADRAFT_256606 [Galerina marginata CBS 339.88]|uniref:Phosphoribulokinase/uridine kinase domain-containing protein n=1 Tax=Galerina marginata (strain CBS 339.88) TaxID=685588 RepID=A0A067SM15_GALM3|nr:hypothetical protein GALMADRAFT_256606 [Galerina marginata CBS 339.88]
MDAEIEELSRYLVDKLESTPSPQRLLVGIAGIPASGKSTFSLLLTERTNRILQGRLISSQNSSAEDKNQRPLSIESDVQPTSSVHGQAILVGLDGWHLSRAQLDVLPDPQLAHDRRGIHWTFDGTGYVDFLQKLRDTTNTAVITAPSFDHALKDPSPDAVSIHPHHRIVIIEGLYVFLAVPPWSDAELLLDERWFVEVDTAEARRRLVGRHVLTGVAKDAQEAEWRADENDIPNGQFIIANMLEPTMIIQSKNIPALSGVDAENTHV